MAQLLPDSHLATWSHSPSVAAPACPARARLPLPMTAPVKAILATFLADAVGLRCRPLMGAMVPLLSAREVSCRVRAGEVARPSSSSTTASPQGTASGSWSYLFGGPVGPPPSIQVVCRCPVHRRMELGAVGARRASQNEGSTGLGLNRNGSRW